MFYWKYKNHGLTKMVAKSRLNQNLTHPIILNRETSTFMFSDSVLAIIEIIHKLNICSWS